MKPSNKVIISSKGFYSKSYFDKEKREFVIVWCERIKDALFMKQKHAVAFINNHKLDAFIWSPYTEYEKEDRYRIKLYKKNEFGYDDEPVFATWVFEKVYDEKDSDVNFLKKRTLPKEKTYTLEEAKRIVYKKNKELIELINTENRKYIEEKAKKFKL